MTEKRRLFINPNRLNHKINPTGDIKLTSDELHYLSRVMRMKAEDLLEVLDGQGHLWAAKFVEKQAIRLTSSFDDPLQVVSRDKPLISIAVVIPKKGFDNFLQMSCEIGIDVIQPLISKRSVVKLSKNEKINRYKKIIHEAVEQSERLWCPEIRDTLEFPNWVNSLSSDSKIGFATTRIEELQDCQQWLKGISRKDSQVWVVIGPEGGWNKEEEELAFESGFVGISLGKTILRTSTAAVCACHLLSSWRSLKSTSLN